jgi:hypothetical protein
MKFNIVASITREDVSGLLVSALEGGSNYWYEIVGEQIPKKSDLFYMNEKDRKENKVFSHIQFPLSRGGGLTVVDKCLDEAKHKGKKWTLNLSTIEDGLNTMLKKYPRHFADFLSGDYDAETGDVFLQCCLFGDAVYG